MNNPHRKDDVLRDMTTVDTLLERLRGAVEKAQEMRPILDKLEGEAVKDAPSRGPQGPVPVEPMMASGQLGAIESAIRELHRSLDDTLARLRRHI